MSDVDVLESVLTKDAALLAGVSGEQAGAPTPCPGYDVRALTNHIVGWVRVFAAAANERSAGIDPAEFVSTDPVAEFQAAATELIDGWRTRGVDRSVRLTGPEVPGRMALAMSLMEYVTHGCDLAIATGQDVPFSDDELALTLERARATLPEQFRGEGKPFGHIVEVPDDAPMVDRLLGFMGRQPSRAVR
ncbi:TIGR03086 family metal-binding protein [Pseudonocardia acaciae]|uniref:TIGR03086 family metal-binding protein n=1 Tax=Pseudonocardia acaciae TaxID=551276 RepID=UPI000491DFCD|nr:TIGR03086 family metal-binding protein [Pseudonocardia acaciae]